MKVLAFLFAVLLATLAVACSGGSESNPGSSGPAGSMPGVEVRETKSSLETAVTEWVEVEAVDRGWIIHDSSIGVEWISDRSAEAHVVLLYQPNPNSTPIEQKATLDVRNPTGDGWVVYGAISSWENTRQQQISVEATQVAYAVATEEAYQREIAEAHRLTQVSFTRTSGIPWQTGPVWFEAAIFNGSSKPYSVRLRAQFRFPEGEVINTESFDRTIQPGDDIAEAFQMMGDGNWPDLDKYRRSWDPVTGETINESPLISLISWQLVINGSEGEIHTVN